LVRQPKTDVFFLRKSPKPPRRQGVKECPVKEAEVFSAHSGIHQINTKQ